MTIRLLITSTRFFHVPIAIGISGSGQAWIREYKSLMITMLPSFSQLLSLFMCQSFQHQIIRIIYPFSDQAFRNQNAIKRKKVNRNNVVLIEFGTPAYRRAGWRLNLFSCQRIKRILDMVNGLIIWFKNNGNDIKANVDIEVF
jgi:hypothetical protein